jgi:hypothetical protein
LLLYWNHVDGKYSVSYERWCFGLYTKVTLQQPTVNSCQYGESLFTKRRQMDINLFSITSQSHRSREIDGEKFHIFGSVHAMKTEIPPFDSEIKDQLVPNDSDSHY